MHVYYQLLRNDVREFIIIHIAAQLTPYQGITTQPSNRVYSMLEISISCGEVHYILGIKVYSVVGQQSYTSRSRGCRHRVFVLFAPFAPSSATRGVFPALCPGQSNIV